MQGVVGLAPLLTAAQNKGQTWRAQEPQLRAVVVRRGGAGRGRAGQRRTCTVHAGTDWEGVSEMGFHGRFVSAR